MKAAAFAFGAILPCVFINGVTGFSLETNWALLWLCLPIALFGLRIRPTPAHFVGAAFVVWAALSFAWAPQWDYAVEAALKLGVAACTFLIGAEVDDDEWIFKGLAVGIGINSAVATAQYFGYTTALTGGTAAGLLYNSNALAEPAALVALVLLLDGRILWALPAAPAIILPGTRAGLLILGAGVLAWLWQRSRHATILLAVALASLGTLTLINGYRLPSTEQRVAIWQDTAAGLSTFGHGLGSFGHSYPRFATHINTAVERPFHAHSDFLEVTFELGYIGLGLLLSFCGLLVFQAAPRERILFLACLAIAAVDFPLFVPTSAFVVALLAGRAAAGWRQHGLQRGDRGSDLPSSDEVRGPLRSNRSLG